MIHSMTAAAPIGLLAAFVAGVAGSVHCLAMCGGLSGALGMRARKLGASPARTFLHNGSYQIGRVGSYALAGALCGSFGGLLATLLDLSSVTRGLRIVAGLLLITISLRVLVGWRAFAGLEHLGAKLWMRLSPLARPIQRNHLGGSLLLGALWGWLPCGMVYSMLLFAALSGSALQGAATMLMFGVGTWPAMLGGSLLSAQVWRLSAARAMHTVAGALLLVFGVLTVLAPLQHVHH
jgi:sulfite exporter TauE/SafE